MTADDMAARYLYHNDTVLRGHKIDFVVSYMPGPRAPRTFYAAFVTFWMLPMLGNLVIYTEEHGRNDALEGCIKQLGCEAWMPQFARMNADSEMKLDHEFNVKHRPIQNLQMQLWKFDADRVCASSIIAFIDDDSCFYDHVLPGEVMNAHGQLVVTGFHPKKIDENVRFREINSAMGIKYHAQFMTDFPVCVHVCMNMHTDACASFSRPPHPPTTPQLHLARHAPRLPRAGRHARARRARHLGCLRRFQRR